MAGRPACCSAGIQAVRRASWVAFAMARRSARSGTAAPGTRRIARSIRARTRRSRPRHGRLRRRRSSRECWPRRAAGPGAELAMYGKSRVDFPQRIVCLTAETTEIAFMLGAGDRVVGVPGTARRPEAARERARVGGFTTFRTDKILALQPDLVLAFSDLQRDVVGELIAAGVTVLCTNQRSFEEVLGAILLIGGALGCERQARELIGD